MDMKTTTKSDTVTPWFTQNEHGELTYTSPDTGSVKVTSSLCFPWMKDNEFISIRDEQGTEITLIEKLTELDEISKQAVIQSLLTETFMMNIIAINKINTEFEIRHWDVITQQGPYLFQTQIDYWPQRLNKTGILIHDVAGNIFYIADLNSLNEKSQQLLWPFLD